MGLATGKTNSIVQHYIYEISTGKWPPGKKLPSVREAENKWGVNRLTVLSAYQELAALGLVEAKDRRGYFVIMNQDGKDLTAKKELLRSLYLKIKHLVKTKTDFQTAAVLRYLTSLAEQEETESPELAFLECSVEQSEGHVSEIQKKFNIHPVPVCLEPDQDIMIPSSVSTLLTTGFHIKEVQTLAKKMGLQVANIPIEIDPNVFKDLPGGLTQAVILEREEAMSDSIIKDLKELKPEIKFTRQIIQEIHSDVASFLDAHPDQFILLSPRIWGRIGKDLQKEPRVRLIRFRITESGWQTVIKAAKLPFPVPIEDRTSF